MKARILRLRELAVGVGDAAIPVIRVHFSTEGFPPRNVWIDKTKFSLQAVKDFIKADMESYFNAKVEKVEVENWEDWADWVAQATKPSGKS